MSSIRRLTDVMRHRLGMDRAIAYTFASRLTMIIGSTGTVLLIVKFLSKIQQGYYYTLLSLISLQIVFELGFSFVILQLAAHEAVHLRFHHDGIVEGDSLPLTRLSAILRKTIRWYLIIGAIMVCTLMAAGMVFFHHTAPNQSSIWLGPWIAAVFMTLILFVLNPFASFLEGCGQVRQVAGMRLFQAIAAIGFAWSALLLGKGLYSPAAVNAGQFLVALAFLYSRRKLFRHLLRVRTAENVLSWREEVWSFQWKVAITWLSTYFTVQVLTPIMFASVGPVEAGRLGMSISIAAYSWNLVFAWMSTKAAPFGRLVANREFAQLDSLFFKTLWQSLGVLGGSVIVCMAGIVGIQRYFPSLAGRMVSPRIFVLLLLSALSTLVIQSLAIYLRAHKEEPLLWQMLTVAILTSVGSYLVAHRWGVTGVCIVYFVCVGVVGLVWASIVFRQRRRSRGDVVVDARLPIEATI